MAVDIIYDNSEPIEHGATVEINWIDAEKELRAFFGVRPWERLTAVRIGEAGIKARVITIESPENDD